MKLLSMALILAMAAAPTMAASDQDSPEAVAKFTNAITTAFITVVDSGNTAWAHLAQGQAKDTLQTLGTDTANLANSKNDLRVYIQSGNATEAGVNTKIEAMKLQIKAMKQLMGTFAAELDTAAHPIGENLRVQIAHAETGKVVELDEVEYKFEQHNLEAAIKALDKAIEDLGTMSKAITCFQNSITNKKAACDPQTLKPTT
jgi:hypothetical protein